MDYSVVVPVYNSDASLEILYDEIAVFFNQINASYEVIFINDGSITSTYKALESIKARYDTVVKVIHLPENIGQQKALVQGLKHAIGTYAITIDDDLQHDITEVQCMILEAEKGSDLVFGTYKVYGDRPMRALGSKFLGVVFRILFRTLKENRVSAFRLIHHSIYKQIDCSLKRFVYLSAELLKHAQNVTNVHINRRNRIYGTSGYTLRKCLRLGLNLIYHYGRKSNRIAHRKVVGSYETHPHGRRRKLSTKCHKEN